MNPRAGCRVSPKGKSRPESGSGQRPSARGTFSPLRRILLRRGEGGQESDEVPALVHSAGAVVAGGAAGADSLPLCLAALAALPDSGDRRGRRAGFPARAPLSSPPPPWGRGLGGVG